MDEPGPGESPRDAGAAVTPAGTSQAEAPSTALEVPAPPERDAFPETAPLPVAVPPQGSAHEPAKPGRAPTRSPRRFFVTVVLASLLAGTAGGAGAAWWMGQRETSVPSGTPTPTVTVTVGGSAASSPTGAASGQDPMAALPALVEKITLSVVAIDSTSQGSDRFGMPTTEESSGTGFVIGADGLIATNYHVVEGASRITVTLADGSEVAGRILGTDPSEDLAVVKIARTGLAPLTLADDYTVRVGDFVIAAGNALALAGSPTVTVGIISALDRSITVTDGRSLTHLLQTDAAISAGDSGGPLLTASGDVIGINTAAASGTVAQNIGFAIPISRAKAILFRLAGLT